MSRAVAPVARASWAVEVGRDDAVQDRGQVVDVVGRGDGRSVRHENLLGWKGPWEDVLRGRRCGTQRRPRSRRETGACLGGGEGDGRSGER
jgi:hypothetical protein